MDTPTISISRRATRRWKQQHPWIYRSDILDINANSGDIVQVRSDRNRPLGWAFYSARSEISLRRISFQSQSLPENIWEQRILDAQKRRELLLPPEQTTYRLIHGEADGIPATIIDRYDSIFVIQTLNPASDRLKQTFTSILVQHFQPTAIIERNDPKVRDLEGLSKRKGLLYGQLPDEHIVDIDGLKFHIDLLNGQKTGAFLDQITTIRRTKPLLKNAQHILEACSYQGWFSCHAASLKHQPQKIVAVDISEPALDILNKNAQLNNLSQRIETIANNVFSQLRSFDQEKRSFDAIFLDPPSFIKNKKAMQAGLSGYKELNLRSLRLLKPNGILFSSSCSYHLDRTTFWNLLQEIAIEQKMTLQLLDVWGQGPDHPAISNFPESHYLKTLVIRRLD